MCLNIHTIFKLRENILFLEEWIQYHMYIGASKFYLYDNSKSIGVDGSTTNINKYGYNFKEITDNLSDSDINTLLEEIIETYKDNIIYQKWEPKDVHGNIIYDQEACILEYLNSNSDNEEWTAFIDIDEFIYSDRCLLQLLKTYDGVGIGDILLLQKKFDDRFNNLDKPVSKIVKCIEGINTRFWAPKHIIKNKYFDKDFSGHWSIHSIPVKDCHTLQANIKSLRFNHYNVNKRLLKWMRSFYHTKYKFKLNAECHELYDLFYKKL